MKNLVYCKKIPYSGLVSLLFAYVQSADSSQEQRTKIIACLNLSRARMYQDEVLIKLNAEILSETC